MTPGRAAFERVVTDRRWDDLTDDERKAWEAGAAMPPVGAVLRLVMDDNRKEL